MVCRGSRVYCGASRYSRTRRGIGSIRQHWGPLGYSGLFGSIRGCRGCQGCIRSLAGTLGTQRTEGV